MSKLKSFRQQAGRTTKRHNKIIRDYYPELEPDDVRACIQHAIDVMTAEDIHVATTP